MAAWLAAWPDLPGSSFLTGSFLLHTISGEIAHVVIPRFALRHRDGAEKRMLYRQPFLRAHPVRNTIENQKSLLQPLPVRQLRLRRLLLRRVLLGDPSIENYHSFVRVRAQIRRDLRGGA